MAAVYDDEGLKKAEQEGANDSSGSDDSNNAEDPYQKLRGEWGKAKAADETAGRSFYKQTPGEPRRTAVGLLKKRKTWLVAAGSLSIVGIILAAIFGFLNVFRLDHIISNIDQHTFARFNSVADRRSNRWVAEYLALRLTQFKGDAKTGNSEYFRAAQVQTGQPVRDWFRTLNASRFEDDLRERGVMFVNKSNDKLSFAKLQIDGAAIQGLDGEEIINKLNSGTLGKDIIKEVEIELNKPGGNKAAREVIKDMTHNHNVLTRRQVRKAIQNMTGVRSWRFFEKTRDKVDATKIDIRNKLITAMVPEGTKTGRLVRCLFGVDDCRGSVDPNNPENQASGKPGKEREVPDESDNVDECPKVITNPDGTTTCVDIPDRNGDSDSWPHESAKGGKNKPVKWDFNSPEGAAEGIKSITRGVFKGFSALGWIGVIDSLSKVNDNIKNGSLVKMVSVSKGTQAMALYQVFRTSRDQMKSGEVNTAQVNKLMQMSSQLTRNDGWQKVVENKGDAAQLTDSTDSQKYCADDSQPTDDDYAYMCPDKQIGGASNAAAFTNIYNNSFGKIIGPVLDLYAKIKHNSSFIGKIIFSALNVFNRVSGAITNAVAAVFKSATSLDFQAAMQKLIEKLSVFMGAGPILQGNEPFGQYMNWMVQGGAYTAETTARALGGAKPTTVSIRNSTEILARYQKDQQANMSIYERYLSTSNPDSPAAKGVFAISQFRPSEIGEFLNLGSFFKKTISRMTAPFNHSAAAAGNDAYRGCQFSAIQCFDIAPECLDLEPSTAEPIDGTNALAVFKANDIPVTAEQIAKFKSWDVETDSDAFYKLVYEVIGDKEPDPDRISLQIYNCNLFDTAIRGGLGFVYGYTEDHGLEETSTSTGGTGSTGAGGGGGTVPIGTTAQLAQKILSYKGTKYNCDENQGDCYDLEQEAAGKSIRGGMPGNPYQACEVDDFDPRVLKTMLYVIEVGGFNIGTYALCGNHYPGTQHVRGKAVDIRNVNGRSLAGPASSELRVEALRLLEFLNKLPRELRPLQLISAGYGGVLDEAFMRLELDGGQSCGTTCYGPGTHAGHDDHIHVGY